MYIYQRVVQTLNFLVNALYRSAVAPYSHWDHPWRHYVSSSLRCSVCLCFLDLIFRVHVWPYDICTFRHYRVASIHIFHFLGFRSIRQSGFLPNYLYANLSHSMIEIVIFTSPSPVTIAISIDISKCFFCKRSYWNSVYWMSYHIVLQHSDCATVCTYRRQITMDMEARSDKYLCNQKNVVDYSRNGKDHNHFSIISQHHGI